MINNPEIVGSAPVLVNVKCRALLCEQYWHQGELHEPANVIHLNFEDQWHRLTFDFGTIYWSRQAEAPKPYVMSELDAEVRIDDVGERLGLQGLELESYAATKIPGGTEVQFNFAAGRRVTFANVNDSTSIASCRAHDLGQTVADRTVTIVLSYENKVLGTAFLAPGAPPVTIGGIPSMDIFIPRRGFEHVGRKEARLELIDQGMVQLTRLKTIFEFRVDGEEVDERAVLKPGRHDLSIGPTLFTLSILVGRVDIDSSVE